LRNYFEPLGYSYIDYPVFEMYTDRKKPSQAIRVSDCKTPTDFFQKMWDDRIYKLLLGEKNFTPKARKLNYLSVAVLKKFFGMILMKGVIGLVSVNDYETKYFTLEFEGKSNILPRNVFFEISGNLVFDLKPIHNILLENFQSHVQPGYFVTIDEIRIPSRHYNCEDKKYNAKKPDQWAIESKSLNDSSKYLLHFTYPLGDDTPTPKQAVSLFTHYLKTTGRKHHITLDSNFLSAEDIPLVDEEGEDMGFESTISCKKTRPSNIWKELQKDLPRGYTRVISCEDRVVSCTFNNGFVNIASNLFSVKDSKEFYKPSERRTLLEMYDKTKGYSDNFGQLVKSYFPDEKFQNHELTLLVGWLMYATTNAYILALLRGSKISHREFQCSIARDLLFSQ
jgi:Transposase IS4